MTDITLELAADLSRLQAGLRQAEAQVARSIQQMERVVRVQVARLDRAYERLVVQVEGATEAQQEASKSGQAVAQSINLGAAAATAAATGWNLLAAAVTGAVAGLAAASAAKAVEAEQTRSLTDRVIQLGAAYVSVRGIYQRFLDIVGTGAQFEIQRLQFEGLFNSVARGEQAFRWVNEFPKQAQGFGDALRSLQAFGVSDLFGTLETLNDAVLTLGDSGGRLQRVADAIGRSFAAGRLQTQELNQLIDAGIPVFDVFEKALGLTAAQVRALATEGRLGRREIEAFIGALGERFAGSAARQADSLIGLLNRLRREWSQFVALIANAGVLDFARDALRGLLDELARLRDSGELATIAQNISDAFTLLGRGVVANLEAILRGLLDFVASGDILTVFGTLGGALERLAPVTELVAGNLRNLVFLSSALSAASLTLSIALPVANFLTLVAVLAIFRVQILAVLGIIGRFVLQGAAVTAITGRWALAVTGLLTILRAKLLLMGGVITAVAALGAALFIAARATGAARAEQEAYRRALAESERAAQSFAQLQAEAERAGLDALRERVVLLNRARELHIFSAEETLATAQRDLALARELQQQEAQAVAQLDGLRQQIADAQIARAERVARETLQSVIASNQREISETQNKIKAIERLEQQGVDRLKEIRARLTEIDRTAEERLLDLRREGLSEAGRSAAAQLEIGRRLVEVRNQLREAQEAETEEQREAALAAARAAQQRAETLTEDIQGQATREQAIRRAAEAEREILQTEQALIEQQQAARAEQRRSLEEQADGIKAEIESIEQALEALAADDTIIRLESNAAEVEQEVDRLREALERLQEAAREANRELQRVMRADVPSAPNFQRGGVVPGAATGWIGRPGMVGPDRVLIRAARGEVVLNRHQQIPIEQALREKYGYGLRTLFHRIRIPHTAPITRRLLADTDRLPAFATGGMVTAPSSTPAPRTSTTDSMTLNLIINRRPIGAVTGARETVRALNEALSQLARAT